MLNTLEFDPALIYFIEIAVVECPVKLSWELIVEWTFSIEFIMDPLSGVCRPVDTVIEGSLTVDTIIFEISLIVYSILID